MLTKYVTANTIEVGRVYSTKSSIFIYLGIGKDKQHYWLDISQCVDISNEISIVRFIAQCDNYSISATKGLKRVLLDDIGLHISRNRIDPKLRLTVFVKYAIKI